MRRVLFAVVLALLGALLMGATGYAHGTNYDPDMHSNNDNVVTFAKERGSYFGGTRFPFERSSYAAPIS